MITYYHRVPKARCDHLLQAICDHIVPKSLIVHRLVKRWNIFHIDVLSLASFVQWLQSTTMIPRNLPDWIFLNPGLQKLGFNLAPGYLCTWRPLRVLVQNTISFADFYGMTPPMTKLAYKTLLGIYHTKYKLIGLLNLGFGRLFFFLRICGIGLFHSQWFLSWNLNYRY